jgi:hypothetical protein
MKISGPQSGLTGYAPSVAIGGGSVQPVLSLNTDGYGNVGIGYEALSYNTIGGENTAVGVGALDGNTSGNSNTSVGAYAAQLSYSKSANTAVGAYSLITAKGSNNTAVGTNSLGSIVGDNNVALGNYAGKYRGTGTSSLSSGTGGIYIGHEARGSANATTNQIVIGTKALGLGSDTAVIGATSQTAATIYGLMNLPGGLSAAGATFSAPITSTRMARHTSAVISAEKTADFTPTAAEDGTVFYVNYGGKGFITITFEGLPVGWRAKFFNINIGTVSLESTTGAVHGYGATNGLGEFMLEVICFSAGNYFAG